MADEMEKTEEATPKKIEDARKEGNVPKSMDAAGFVALFVAILALIFMMEYIMDKMKNLFYYHAALMGQPLGPGELVNIAVAVMKEAMLAIIPIGVIVAVAGSLGNIFQFGLLFTTKPLVPDLKKIDPIKGTKNLFSLKKLVEAVKITAKVGVAFTVGSVVFLQFISELPTVELFPFQNQMAWLAEKAIFIAAAMLLVFLVFGVIDLAIVRYQHFKSLKMSKQEIKDEYKQTEGSPEVKARIRRLQYQMANNRMMADVPGADVVVTNPTHYAVAIKYDQEENAAPMVVAKGVDFLAQKIKEIARENDVQIVENPPLARELYKLVGVGDEIPDALYQAVAEVLAYVYRIKNKM